MLFLERAKRGICFFCSSRKKQIPRFARNDRSRGVGAWLPKTAPRSRAPKWKTPGEGALVAVGSYGHLHGGRGQASHRPVTLFARFSIVENQAQVTEIE